MSFRKRLIATAAVCTMAALALYGSTLSMRPREENKEYSLLGEKETIYFWYEDDSLTNYLNSAAVSFGEREDVRVIPQLTSESEYLEAINEASLRSEQIPDAYILTNESLGKAYLAGLASEILDKAGVCDERLFPKAALNAVTYHGKRIAYPLSYETSVLVYNQTYLEEWANQQASKTPEEFEEEEGEELLEVEEGEADSEGEDIAEDASENVVKTAEEYLAEAVPTTVDGILSFADSFDVPENVEGVFEWDVSDILYNYWFVGNYMVVGGEQGDDPSMLIINNEETVQCLEAYKAMNQFFSIESETTTYDSVVEDFIQGKTVFTVATTDIVKRLEEAKAAGEFAYEYGIATMPDVNAELGGRSMSVTNAVVINGYSRHRELAERFAQYLTTEAAGELYDKTGKMAACASAYTQEGAYKTMFAEYADSVPLPKMIETENYWMHLEVLFSKIWNGKDVAEALTELDEQMRLQMSQ